MNNPIPDDLLLAVKARSLKGSFLKFVKEAWPIATGFAFPEPSPHITLLCRHMEAVASGEITQLTVSVPPSTLKSSVISVLFMPWVWASNPSASFLCFSYSATIGTNFSTKCREVMRSSWYRDLFPDIAIADDDDQKAFFRLTAGGYRKASTIEGAGTSLHPDHLVLDDPLNATEAQSYQARAALKTFYFETLGSRGLTKNVRHVIVSQRLHPEDLTGAILEHDRQMIRDHGESEWTHITLPMRFDPSRAMPDKGFGGDWRQEPGELLFPSLLPEKVVAKTERTLGLAASEAQLGQNPQRRDGGSIKVSQLRVITSSELPRRFDAITRFWDLASTQDGGDFTVGCLMGKASSVGNDAFFILDICRGQWSGDGVIDQMIATSLRDQAKYGELAKVIFERQPNGTWAAEQFAKRLRQFRVSHVAPKGSKELRAEPFGTSIAYSEVSIVDGPFLSVFLDELETFPGGRHDDQVDAAAGAFNSLQGATSSSGTGIILPAMTSVRDPSSWEIPKCANPSCGRPAFGIGSSKEYCCQCCEIAHEWEEEIDKHDPQCALKFNDWYVRNSPVDNERSSFKSSYRKRF